MKPINKIILKVLKNYEKLNKFVKGEIRVLSWKF